MSRRQSQKKKKTETEREPEGFDLQKEIKKFLRDRFREIGARQHTKIDEIELHECLKRKYPWLVYILAYVQTKDVGAYGRERKKLEMYFDIFFLPESSQFFDREEEDEEDEEEFKMNTSNTEWNLLEEFLLFLQTILKTKIQLDKERKDKIMDLAVYFLANSTVDTMEVLYKWLENYCSNEEIAKLMNNRNIIKKVLEVYKRSGNFESSASFIERISDFYRKKDVEYSKWVYRYFLEIINNHWRRIIDSHEELERLNQIRMKCEETIFQLERVKTGYSELPHNCIQQILGFQDFLILPDFFEQQNQPNRTDNSQNENHQNAISKYSLDPKVSIQLFICRDGKSGRYMNMRPNVWIKKSSEEDLKNGKLYEKNILSFLNFIPKEINVLRLPFFLNNDASSPLRLNKDIEYTFSCLNEVQVSEGDLNRSLFHQFLMPNRKNIQILRTACGLDARELELNIAELDHLQTLRLGSHDILYEDLKSFEGFRELRSLTLPQILFPKKPEQQQQQYSQNQKKKNKKKKKRKNQKKKKNQNDDDDRTEIFELKMPLSLKELQIGKVPEQGYDHYTTNFYNPECSERISDKNDIQYPTMTNLYQFPEPDWEYFFHFRLKRVIFHNCYFKHKYFPPLPPSLEDLRIISVRTEYHLNQSSRNNRERRDRSIRYMVVEYPPGLNILHIDNSSIDFRKSTKGCFVRMKDKDKKVKITWKRDQIKRCDIRDLISTLRVEELNMIDVRVKEDRRGGYGNKGSFFHDFETRNRQKSHNDNNNNNKNTNKKKKKNDDDDNDKNDRNEIMSTGLKKLSLFYCKRITDDDLNPIPTSLESLRIKRCLSLCRLNENTMKSLRDLRLLLFENQKREMLSYIKSGEFKFENFKKLRKIVINIPMEEKEVRKLKTVYFCRFDGVEWIRIHGFLMRNL